MSSVSVTSSKREKVLSELEQELESIKTLNSSLHAYLEHLRQFKKNITDMNSNFKQLGNVNKQWMDTLYTPD